MTGKKFQDFSRPGIKILHSRFSRTGSNRNGDSLESELDAIAACVEGLVQDVHQTERQLKRMQHDTLSQMYSCHEVARLELEQKQLSQNLNDQVCSGLHAVYITYIHPLRL